MGMGMGYKLVLEASVLALTMTHASLVGLFIVIITMPVSPSVNSHGSALSVQAGIERSEVGNLGIHILAYQ